MRPATYTGGMYPLIGRPLYPELWDGCIGAWAPCLGPTGLTLRDWSGFGRNGTLTATATASDVWTPNQGRYAAYFGGVGKGVSIADSDAYDFGLRPFAISFWFNMPPRNGNWAILTKDQWISGATGVLFYGATGSANTLFYYSGAPRSCGAILDSTWHHVAVSRTSTAANGTALYVDGKSVMTFTESRNFSNSFPLHIGTDADLFYGIIGSIDDVRVYQIAPPPEVFARLGSRRGIAYELAPRRRASVAVQFNRRRRLLVGASS